MDTALSRALSVPIESEPRLQSFVFDTFSSREPVSTPDQVRGSLSLENALDLAVVPVREDRDRFPVLVIGMVCDELIIDEGRETAVNS